MCRMGLFQRLENFALNAAPEIRDLIATNDTYGAAEACIRHWRTQIETSTPVGSVQDAVWKPLRQWMIGWHVPPKDDAEWNNHLHIRFGAENNPRTPDDNNRNIGAVAQIAMTIESIRTLLKACKSSPDDQTIPNFQPSGGNFDFIARKKNPALTAEIIAMLESFYPTVTQRLSLSAAGNSTKAAIIKLLGSFVEAAAIHAQIPVSRSVTMSTLVGTVVNRKINLKSKPQEDPGHFMLGQEKIPLRLSSLNMHVLRVEALGVHTGHSNSGVSGLAASHLQKLWEGQDNLPVMDLARLQSVP